MHDYGDSFGGQQCVYHPFFIDACSTPNVIYCQFHVSWLYILCIVLKEFIPELNITPSPDFKDIFGNVQDQLTIVKVFMKIKRQREILFEALSINTWS